MRRLPSGRDALTLLERGALSGAQIERAAAFVARFHDRTWTGNAGAVQRRGVAPALRRPGAGQPEAAAGGARGPARRRRARAARGRHARLRRSSTRTASNGAASRAARSMVTGIFISSTSGTSATTRTRSRSIAWNSPRRFAGSTPPRRSPSRRWTCATAAPRPRRSASCGSTRASATTSISTRSSTSSRATARRCARRWRRSRSRMRRSIPRSAHAPPRARAATSSSRVQMLEARGSRGARAGRRDRRDRQEHRRSRARRCRGRGRDRLRPGPQGAWPGWPRRRAPAIGSTRGSTTPRTASASTRACSSERRRCSTRGGSRCSTRPGRARPIASAPGASHASAARAPSSSKRAAPPRSRRSAWPGAKRREAIPPTRGRPSMRAAPPASSRRRSGPQAELRVVQTDRDGWQERAARDRGGAAAPGRLARVSGFEREERRRGAGERLRAGLRRHGVIPRPAALRKLLRASDVRFTRGNRVELFRDGRSGLDAMLAAIEGARHRVHLESYIFRADEIGQRFLRALTSRARAGVEVRLLFDGVGSLGLPPAALAELRAAGGDAVAFNPLGRIWPRWAPRRRDHRKILIVDDERGLHGRSERRRRVLLRLAGRRRAPHCRGAMRICVSGARRSRCSMRSFSRAGFAPTLRTTPLRCCPPRSWTSRAARRWACSPTVPPTTGGACASC